MGWETGKCDETSIFIVAPSLEGWLTKAKQAPSPYEVRLTPLDTNPEFQFMIVHSAQEGQNLSK